MGKKKFRGTYTSKGQRPNVSRENLKLAEQEVSLFDRALFKIEAWKRGKNPWITIKNPNHLETAKRYIKVRANSYYGDFKKRRQETATDE